MALIVRAAVFLVLPQLAGWIATRVTRRSSAVPWPATAIAAFSTLWYVLDWLPAQHAAARSGCGMGEESAQFMLAVGLIVHTIAGVKFGTTIRRWRA